MRGKVGVPAVRVGPVVVAAEAVVDQVEAVPEVVSVPEALVAGAAHHAECSAAEARAGNTA
jgi:alanine-alpha-ketoisovalerate/valine-pyruvate aminotransferase